MGISYEDTVSTPEEIALLLAQLRTELEVGGDDAGAETHEALQEQDVRTAIIDDVYLGYFRDWFGQEQVETEFLRMIQNIEPGKYTLEELQVLRDKYNIQGF